MNINALEYKTAENKFLNANNELRIRLINEIKVIFKVCKNKVDSYSLVEESNCVNQMKEDFSGFYYVIASLSFKPYDCYVKSLEILQKTDFPNLLKSVVSIDSNEFDEYALIMLQEIFRRKLYDNIELNFENALIDLENYLFNKGVYEISNANAILLVEAWKLKSHNLYIETPLLCLGHVLMKDLAEQRIKNPIDSEEVEARQKAVLSLLAKGCKPFDNFPEAINVLYNSLITLKTISLTRDEFLQRIVDNYYKDDIDKISLDLRNERLSTKQIGFLFFNLRERFCQTFEKHYFRIWFQKCFIVIKKNGEFLKIEHNQTASDLLAQHSIINEGELHPKYAYIHNLIP
ncbi:hypothetical protein BBFL7_00857 [Flavobacteria bacterium BBFL7]|nr:hypothetical protein BBFL7_00857 [Flavobacteria bacterium BBFL7]